MVELERHFILWAVLCLAVSHAIPNTGERRSQPDSGRSCKCSGLFSRRLDCSNRERSVFSTEELCAGRTTAIDLSRNFFTSFPSRIGRYVVEVNISSNSLTDIPRAPPLNPGTTLLDVSNNHISHSTNELRDLSSLRMLVINGNRLQALNFLPENCTLHEIRAHNNVIRSLEGPLSHCTLLQRLDLSDNQLASLPSLFGLVNLEELVLQRAGLFSVTEGAFESLQKLERLDLTENMLTSLPSGVCSSLKNLRVLLLDGNSIGVLTADVFVGPKNLDVLSLANNRLTNLSQGLFSDLRELNVLKLNQNHLRSLSGGIFYGLRNLKNIDLSGNELEVLPPRLFAGLSSLQVISLDKNRLKKLPTDLLFGITSLKMLDLKNNQLTALPTGLFHGTKSIEVLVLSHNNFTAVNGRDLSGLERINLLVLENNQISTLPTYEDNAWPATSFVILDDNKIASASEAALRSWLGSGAEARVVSLGVTSPLRSAWSLRWLLTAKEVTTTTSVDCACGGVQRGRAEVQFCVAVPCPDDVASWLDAVEASSPASSKVRPRRYDDLVTVVDF